MFVSYILINALMENNIDDKNSNVEYIKKKEQQE